MQCTVGLSLCNYRIVVVPSTKMPHFAALVACLGVMAARESAEFEITKVWLRTTGVDGRWIIEGEGPSWVRFDGGVEGLRFKVGQDFAVQYINELPEPTLVHAHGMTPPHGLDGVPFIDAPPINPGRTALYV